jgi:hypothetical protein
MKKPLASMMATLLTIPLTAAVAQTAGEASSAPTTVPGTAESLPAESADPAKAAPDAPLPAATAQENKTATQTSAGAAPEPAAPTGAAKTPADDKAVEPVTGAFGIPLGEPFVPSMVAEVLGQQEQSYRGKDAAELKGTLYRVKPNQPDDRFQNYSVKTTDAGVVYAIEGDYQIEPKQGNKQDKAKQGPGIRKRCKDAVKSLAGELEARYGEPRGKGWNAEWFAFRQLSDTDNKSIRLYGNRCRTGIYRIVYTDEKLLHGMPAEAARAGKSIKIMAGRPERRATGAAPPKPTPGPEAESSSEADAQTDSQPDAKP